MQPGMDYLWTLDFSQLLITLNTFIHFPNFTSWHVKRLTLVDI